MITLVLTAGASAQDNATSRESPTLSAASLVNAPQIDGIVAGDEAWSDAQPASGFWQVQPYDGAPATQKTEVFVGFTDDALYVGVLCHDDDPAGIIVADSRRDSSLNDTDAFLFIIDGLYDRQNGFVFGTNAAGIEYDGQVTKEGSGDNFGSGGGAFNLNWDGAWTVRAAITEAGWSAEFEIPFRTLRYGRDEPLLAGHLFADDGRVRGYINLFVNGVDLRLLEPGRRQLPPGSVVTIVPSVAGG